MNDNKAAVSAISRAARADRLAAELRANLKRRKAQARARGATNNDTTDPDRRANPTLPPESEGKPRR